MREKRNVQLISPKKGCTGLVSRKINRNSLCSCGSGKKAKKCCGVETDYASRHFRNSEEKKHKSKYDKLAI